MPALADERIILHDISWKTYEGLLHDWEDRSGSRLTYDKGTLEIMSPLIPHERAKNALAEFVTKVLETWEWNFENLGSLTFKRSDKKRGFEPDSCFYIKNVDKVKGKVRLNLKAGDPAPDLVIEIDITHSSLPKKSLLADFNVPEIWRYEEDKVEILILRGKEYIDENQSLALPGLNADTLNAMLRLNRETGKIVWLRAIQEWADKNRP